MCGERLSRLRSAIVCIFTLAGGCDVATANIDIPRTCITEHGVNMPGAPVGGVGSARFSFDIGSDIPLLETDPDKTNVQVDQVTVKPTADNPNLTDITSARIQVGTQNTTVASYTKTASAVSDISLAGSSTNVAPYVLGG